MVCQELLLLGDTRFLFQPSQFETQRAGLGGEAQPAFPGAFRGESVSLRAHHSRPGRLGVLVTTPNARVNRKSCEMPAGLLTHCNALDMSRASFIYQMDAEEVREPITYW